MAKKLRRYQLLLEYIVRRFVLPNLKAIVAFGIAYVVEVLRRQGLDLDLDTITNLEAGLLGLVTATTVWLFPNKPAK